ncbi:NAD-dependent epimerase/dehydratase family protein [Cupriavidus necator]
MVSQKPIVLITGYEGRIGNAIAGELAGAYTIVGLERECHKQGSGCINADITSSESLEHALAQVCRHYGPRLTSVIHLAAFYDFSGEPSRSTKR